MLHFFIPDALEYSKDLLKHQVNFQFKEKEDEIRINSIIDRFTQIIEDLHIQREEKRNLLRIRKYYRGILKNIESLKYEGNDRFVGKILMKVEQ